MKPLLATYYIPLPDGPDGLLRAVGRGVDDVADGEVRLPVLRHQLVVRGLQQLWVQTLSLKVKLSQCIPNVDVVFCETLLTHSHNTDTSTRHWTA